MRKGFIFSITALFFVALIIVFFSLYLSSYKKAIFPEKNTAYENNTVKFFTNANQPPSGNQKWCSVYYIYNPNEQSNTQSTITKKIYCEDYGTKRFI